MPQLSQSSQLSTAHAPVFPLLLLCLLLASTLASCGAAASPAQAQPVVYVIGVSGSDVSLVALRASDGGLLWQTPIPQDSESAVALVTATPALVYVVSGGKPSSGDWSLVALRASDGKVVWSFPSGGMITGVQVLGDSVYVGAQSGLQALRASDGRARWKRDGAVSSLALAGDTLYAAFAGAAGSDAVVALRASDGTARWQARTADAAGQMLVDQTSLYALTGSEMIALQTSDGTERWHVPIAGALLDGMAAGNLYLSQIKQNAVNLTALRVSDGQRLWQRALRSNWYGTPVFSDSAVYAALAADNVCALRPGDGGMAWCSQASQALASSDQTTYVSAATDALCALQARDGSRRWCQPVAASSLIVAADRLALTTPGGAVCALQAASGKQVWCRQVAESVLDLTLSAL